VSPGLRPRGRYPRHAGTCAIAALLAAAPAAAQEVEPPEVRVGGLAFGDLYYVPSHHTNEGEDAAGAVLRRGYLTVDADVSRLWFGRARLELNQAGEFETYTFTADVQDLYVGLRPGRHRVLLGLSPTPTFDLIESIWDLRYLAQTPMDLQGVASRDVGLSAQGPLNGAGTLRYRAMLGTGLEFGAESGDGRKVMGALTWQPSPRWTVDAYGDYEVLAGSTDRATVQVFAGYVTEGLRWGVQYANQDRQDDPPLELASAFAVGRLGPHLSLVGRVDRLIEPSPRGDAIPYLPMDPSVPATLLLGGVELRVAPWLVLTPNGVVTVYDESDQGVRPRTDVHLRLTAFLDLEGAVTVYPWRSPARATAAGIESR
jgi:hypothetical protein